MLQDSNYLLQLPELQIQISAVKFVSLLCFQVRQQEQLPSGSDIQPQISRLPVKKSHSNIRYINMGTCIMMPMNHIPLSSQKKQGKSPASGSPTELEGLDALLS